MKHADHRDVVGGGVLTAVGIAVAVYAMTQLQLGTVQRMGPGFFPAALGVLLAVLGAATVATGFKRQGRIPAPDVAPAIAVLGALVAFSLTIDRFGLLVAVPLLVVIASLASRERRLLPLLLMTIALCAVGWAIFVAGFNLPIRLLKWNP